MKNLFSVLRSDDVADDLVRVIETIVDASKEIAFLVRQGALAGVLGSTQDENIQGETQKQLDVISNQLLKDLLLANSAVAAIASEEEDTVVAGNAAGKYLVAFDPLDGSSNIDINGQIGTIFSIYRVLDGIAHGSEEQFKQKGAQQVCAGYELYGPSTLLVITTGKGTHCFTLDSTQGNFLLTAGHIRIAQDTQEFAINMSNARFWNDNMRSYIDDLILGETGARGKRYNMRWNAAMVGDVHRVMTRGGIFLYPSDNRNAKQPAKLRLLYEANPMAMLIENAGGKACSETQRILDIQPTQLHERVAVILGSANEVSECLGYLQ
ncbi:class 1 fructose-bisphosphatase [Cellvibrio sp. pealriver]|uniref:class 1 fructose-bisphosphatase n=1 Tax=Cellvibrio sp. pealriver TaxID=1622269 RepID=UPI00066FC9EB|nr:class 1 fructose-bisphosphatase [Cellvibrio sp. pealriver]